MMRPAMEAYSRLYKGLGQRFSLYFLILVLFEKKSMKVFPYFGNKIIQKNLTFEILRTILLTISFHSILFQNPGGSPEQDRRSRSDTIEER